MKFTSFIKYIFLVMVCGAMAIQQSAAQTYCNEWIDYNKTYYKFLIGKTGIYRIPQSLLAANGLDNIPAEQFQLWHNGKQVAMFSTKNAGIMSGSDYLEFFGEQNDGTLDTRLYKNAADQLSDHYSLFTDSSAYYLTVNTAGNNLRYDSIQNNTASPPPPENYFMYTAGAYYKNAVNNGFAQIVSGEYIYASSFDAGEGLTSNIISPSSNFSAAFNNLFLYTGGPAAQIKTAIAGTAPNNRTVNIQLNNQSVADTVMNQFATKTFVINNIPLSSFNANNSVRIVNESSVSTDRIVAAYIALTYPRQFNFGNASQFIFQLDASAQAKYLEITNFNTSGIAPILYDVTNTLRLSGDISTAGKVKFLLPASSQPRQLILVNENTSGNINIISSFDKRNFVDYSKAANQGNYLIITNSVLLNDGNGNNYVQQYADYRNSATGGGFRNQIILIDQLIDQFSYGIKNDPLSIRNFSQYAYNNFAGKPQFIFIIGKGVTYDQYRFSESYPGAQATLQVPTWGSPGSDNLLTAFTNSIVPQIPIGRLSAINAKEVNDYLNKVKQYEALQKNTNAADQTFDKIGWQKKVLNIVGADGALAGLLNYYFSGYDNIIEDTAYGGHAITIGKTTLDPVQQSNGYVDTLFANGLGFVNYFGHSSASTLGFNIDDPSELNNQGRYSVFMANGCNAGDIFILDTLRLGSPRTISESYVVSPNDGSIVFLASTYLGITDVLDVYITYFYKQICSVNYGGALGVSIQNTISKVVASEPGNFLHYANAEEITLDGDPAIRTQSSPLPDYDVEQQYVKFNPSIVSVSQGNFNLNIHLFNLGRAVKNDSLLVSIKRILPNGNTVSVLNKNILAPAFEDSLNLNIPVNPLTDGGINRFIISLDSSNSLNEVTKANNQIEADIFIYGNDIKPVHPYNFSIVNEQSIPFYASTANLFAPSHTYNFEIDTTENFNSPLKVAQSISQPGGLVKFNPQISFNNNRVYYWRVSAVPNTGDQTIWNSSSFIYLNDSLGWNQSHYFQFKKDNYQYLNLGDDRTFKFQSINNAFTINTLLYPGDAGNQNITVNNTFIEKNSCGEDLSSLQFVVFNGTTLQPLQNRTVNGSGLYGSQPVCDNSYQHNIFNFQYRYAVNRKNAINFFDSIPPNSLVTVTNWASLTYLKNTTFINDWKADSAQLGSGNTLYDKLKAVGFTDIDSFYHNIPFIFVFKKNADGTITPQYEATGNAGDQLTYKFNVQGLLDNGNIKSPLIGPALSWNGIHWKNHSLDQSAGDTVNMQVFGVNAAGNSTLLYDQAPKDTSLAFIDAKTYPYLQLQFNNRDVVNYTPSQLDYWRVNYQPAPEGALAPEMFLSLQDTLDVGQPLNFSIVFANISKAAFDSLKVKIIITDQNNVPHILPVNRFRKLAVNDTLHISYSIDTKSYPGLNTLYVEANPDNDQPEQYHFNNFIYKQFFVRPDKFNPLVDVTFDGVHILNDDIISSRPHVIIKLKDENKYLALNDTSLMQVQVKYPDGNVHPFYFTNDTLRFTPANPNNVSTNNTAQIDFTPAFLSDGTYELIVMARDKSNNNAGSVAYRVAFEIVNKPMISNLLNYPNPFTTSTAFVFTITGYEMPSQFKIEIMTITGKIVKEITKQELGPLHIGRNITTYRWDGTDQYGQKLANGIYLYRVVTSLHGNKMDLYKSGADKFITHGYGKMYLMR